MSKSPPELITVGATFDGDSELDDFIQAVNQNIDPPTVSFPADLLRTSTKDIRRFDIKTDKFSGKGYRSFIKYILKQKKKYVYISPNGSDITGTGTRRNPYHTLHKAYSVIGSTGPDADLRYIIAKNGVYDLQNIANTPGSTLAMTQTKTLFFGDEKWREKHIVVISENLHGCKIKGSVDLQLDTSYGIGGVSLGIKRYKFNPAFSAYTSHLEKMDFNVYDYDYNATPNVSVTSADTIYPCMLNRGTTGSQYPEYWLSYDDSWTIPKDSINFPSSRFVPYASSPGGTLYGITQTDLVNVVTTRNASGVTTNWTDTTLIFTGGNNNLSYHKIVGISYGAETKINTLSRPSFNGINAVAFIGNKSWLGNTYETAFEIDGNEKYFYIKTDSNINPRVTALKYGINLCRVRNISFIGFDIFEFNQENVGYSSTADNFQISSNITFKYNAFHHGDFKVFHGNFSNSNVIGNLVYKSFYRGLELTDCKDTNIKYNTIAAWRIKSGIMLSNSNKCKVYGNTLYTFASQHGNGMAMYNDCRDNTIEKNFIYVPTNIGIAIQAYGGTASTGSPGPNTGIKDGDGFKIKNNVLFSNRGIKLSEVATIGSPSCGIRGDLAKFEISNNTGSLLIDREATVYRPWWKFNKMAIRNNFLTGPNNTIRNIINIDPSTNHLQSGTAVSGLSGNYILGTTFSTCTGNNIEIFGGGESYINGFNQAGLGYAIYNGVCAASKWNHSWLPGITVNGVMIPDALGVYKWWAYNKEYDGITCLYNNIWLAKASEAVLPESSSAVGATSDFSFTDPQTKSYLLQNIAYSGEDTIFQPGFYFDGPNSTMKIYLVDPTAEATGKYDFRTKSTIQDYNSAPIPDETTVGVNWIGPSYKGFTYSQFMTANIYDWWLYNEGT